MWSAWTLHAWGSTHYSQHTASRNTSAWRALWEAHYLPPRWMKPYRHAEAHGHWRGMQCKSSWKLPFNDGVAWQFWDCQPIMDFAPKPKPSINGLTQLVVETFGLFSSSISRKYRRGIFFKMCGSGMSGGCLSARASLPNLLWGGAPASVRHACGLLYWFTQRGSWLYAAVLDTCLARGCNLLKKGPDRRTCQQQQHLAFQGTEKHQNEPETKVTKTNVWCSLSTAIRGRISEYLFWTSTFNCLMLIIVLSNSQFLHKIFCSISFENLVKSMSWHTETHHQVV